VPFLLLGATFDISVCRSTDEPYTNHEAVPVEEGTKYAANVWVHNYDFRTPATAGCVLTHKNTH
jgi:hypothetical protein